MHRKNIFGAAAIFAVAGLVIAFSYGSTDHTIHRNAAQIQKTIEKSLPKTMNNITVQSATVELHDGRAIITTEITGHKLGKVFHLTGRATGTPDYEHSRNGEFYFRPYKVEVLEYALEGTAPTKFLERAAERYAMKHPGIQNALVDAAPHVEDWIRHAAEAGATMALKHIPVYKLKDDNIGFFMRASLKDVRIEGDELAVKFSLWQFTKLAVVGTIMIVVSILTTFGFFLV